MFPPLRGNVHMTLASDNAQTGYALDSGCPKTLWLPAGRVSQQYLSIAPGAYPEGSPRPIAPAAKVLRVPAVRRPRWTGDDGQRTLRKRVAASRDRNLWWLPESRAYPVAALSDGIPGAEREYCE